MLSFVALPHDSVQSVQARDKDVEVTESFIHLDSAVHNNGESRQEGLASGAMNFLKTSI